MIGGPASRGAAAACAGAALWGLAAGGCADDGGPRLTSVSPPAASRGAMVTLLGARLCGAAGDCARAGGAIDLGRNPPMVRAVVVALRRHRGAGS